MSFSKLSGWSVEVTKKKKDELKRKTHQLTLDKKVIMYDGRKKKKRGKNGKI